LLAAANRLSFTHVPVHAAASCEHPSGSKLSANWRAASWVTASQVRAGWSASVLWKTARMTATGGEIQRFYSTRGQPKQYFRVDEIAAP
jgi:hypothetical protein